MQKAEWAHILVLFTWEFGFRWTGPATQTQCLFLVWSAPSFLLHCHAEINHAAVAAAAVAAAVAAAAAAAAEIKHAAAVAAAEEGELCCKLTKLANLPPLLYPTLHCSNSNSSSIDWLTQSWVKKLQHWRGWAGGWFQKWFTDCLVNERSNLLKRTRQCYHDTVTDIRAQFWATFGCPKMSQGRVNSEDIWQMWRKVHGSCFRLLKPLNAVWILVAAASTSGSVRSMSGIRKNLRITSYILKVNKLAVIYFWAKKNWRKKCVYQDDKILR